METQRNYDVRAAERVFRKIVHPGLDSMHLVDRNGLSLSSAPGYGLRQKSFVISPRGVPTRISNHIYSGYHSHYTRYDGMLGSESPEMFVPQPSPGAVSARVRQYTNTPSLPSKKRAISSKSAFRAMHMTKSASTDRYVGATTPLDKRHSKSAQSEQEQRLDKEWASMANCRALKRSSEVAVPIYREEYMPFSISHPVSTLDSNICPRAKSWRDGIGRGWIQDMILKKIVSHRVDRMYYMSGNSIKLQPRYHVDEDELTQLRELSKSRQSSRQRGSRIPHHPPSSSRAVKTAKALTENGTPAPPPVVKASKAKSDSGMPNDSKFKVRRDSVDNISQQPEGRDPPVELKSAGRKSPLQGWGNDVGREKSEEPPIQNDVIRKESLHDEKSFAKDLDNDDDDFEDNKNRADGRHSSEDVHQSTEKSDVPPAQNVVSNSDVTNKEEDENKEDDDNVKDTNEQVQNGENDGQIQESMDEDEQEESKEIKNVAQNEEMNENSQDVQKEEKENDD